MSVAVYGNSVHMITVYYFN